MKFSFFTQETENVLTKATNKTGNVPTKAVKTMKKRAVIKVSKFLKFYEYTCLFHM